MWTRDLQAGLFLRDGRRLDTVHDALGFILALPKDRRDAEHWDLAYDALTAAERGRATHLDLAAAQRRLSAALKIDGLL